LLARIKVSRPPSQNSANEPLANYQPCTADSKAFFVLPQIYYSEQYTFFGHSPGGTWHGGDVAVVLWFVEKPWALLVIVVVVAVGAYIMRKRQRTMAWSKREDPSNAV
jgi:hypothetical protein